MFVLENHIHGIYIMEELSGFTLFYIHCHAMPQQHELQYAHVENIKQAFKAIDGNLIYLHCFSFIPQGNGTGWWSRVDSTTSVHNQPSRSYLIHNFQTITICSFKLSRPSRFLLFTYQKVWKEGTSDDDDWLDSILYYVPTTKQPYEVVWWL